MSERPTLPNDSSDQPGGWHQPPERGMWYKPEEKSEGIVGWRVPTLPTTLDTEPQEEGEWHLPKSEDTTFTPDDVSEVMGITEPPPDAIDPIDALEVAVQGTGQTDGKAQAAKAPLASPEDLLELALKTGGDDDDGDAFSMSELVALASLMGDTATTTAPAAPVEKRSTSTIPATHIDMTNLSPAERAILTGTGETEVMPLPADLSEEGVDAAEYARRQLAALGEDEGAPAATFGDLLGQTGAQAPATDDPAAYARRQLELLGGATGAVRPVAPAPQTTAPYDPAQAELATRFRNTENQVRALRQQYQSGLMTREDLQTQLRQLMILDNNQVWWMMGVETDTWYKFVNGNWIAAAPPTAPAATGAQSPGEVSLPYLQAADVPYQTQPTQYDPNQYQYSTGAGFNVEDEPLPQQVDRIDQGMTVVGPAAMRFDQEATASLQPTVVSPSYGEPTVMAQPAQYGAYEGVEAPYDAQAEPPDYDLDQEAPIYQDIYEKRRQSTLQLVAIAAAIIIALGFIGAAGFVLLAVSWYNGIVGQWEAGIVALQNYEPQFQTARILDARGDLIVELNSQEGGARTEVELGDISPEMLFAVIALENERFYDDPGWDLIAIIRAFFQNLTAGEIESGASTITQQIAKNLVLQNTEVSAERKMQELVVAAELAKRYDKNFILQLYLNEVFFGNQSYGVEAAAEFYFKHSAADLNLVESAMLAGLIQSPAAYDPVINRDAAFDRMRFVIDRMVEVGCIQFQHAPYLAEPFCINRSDIYTAEGKLTGLITFQISQIEGSPIEPRDVQIKYPHFVNLVQSQLDAIYGTGAMFAQGFVVRTTLIPEIQDAAQNALVSQVAALVNQGVNTGAVMVTDPNTGAIRAMVGSPDFNNAEIAGQVNTALTWQQPGSSIKPIVYTGALEGVDKNGDGRLDFSEYYTPATILWDVPTTYPDGTAIRNFDGQFHGPTALRYALANSYNIPAVKTYGFIGNDKFRDVATRMGLEFLPDCQSPDETNCSRFGLPTGVGATDVRLYDMMEAYGTLASGGKYVRLYTIESVTDSQGRAVELPAHEAPRQVVQPQIAYLMQSILSDDSARAAAFGTGSLLTLPGYPTIDYVAAKTGTSSEGKDLWTMGFTRTAVVGVWLGRHDDNPTLTNGSFTAVAPIWNQVMRAAVQGVQPQAFTNPGNVVLQQICTDTGTLPPANCPAQRGEYFLVSQPPAPADQSFVQTIEIDSWTGLRANANCPDNRIAKTFANIGDQTAVNWLNTTSQGQAYAQRIGMQLPLEIAPTGECSFGAIVPSVRLLSPTDGMTLSGTVSVTGQVSANAGEFNRYQLYYALATAPDQWATIGPASTTQQPNAGAVLGQWDTRTVANGTYLLRLEVISNSGGFINKQATVNVQNALPTATPTVPVIPTSPANLTPIPFDTLPAQSVPGATPTIAVPTG